MGNTTSTGEHLEINFCENPKQQTRFDFTSTSNETTQTSRQNDALLQSRLPAPRSRDDALHAPHRAPPLHDPPQDVYLHQRESDSSKTPIRDEDHLHLHPDPLHLQSPTRAGRHKQDTWSLRHGPRAHGSPSTQVLLPAQHVSLRLHSLPLPDS